MGVLSEPAACELEAGTLEELLRMLKQSINELAEERKAGDVCNVNDSA